MTLNQAHQLIIHPTLAYLAEFIPEVNSSEADVMLLTIGATESGFKHRLQQGVHVMLGAHGFWQCEQSGGCWEFANKRSLAKFRAAARSLSYKADSHSVYLDIPKADSLACIVARALLWLHPAPLPAMDDCKEAYAQYLARWRPGKPNPSRFLAWHKLALGVIESNLNSDEI